MITVSKDFSVEEISVKDFRGKGLSDRQLSINDFSVVGCDEQQSIFDAVAGELSIRFSFLSQVDSLSVDEKDEIVTDAANAAARVINQGLMNHFSSLAPSAA